MREAIKELNKQTLSQATGISYGRLRKYATGIIKDLNDDEREKIYEYLIKVAEKFKTK